MRWWENPDIEKMYGVGVRLSDMTAGGQREGWMLEGLFKTEAEAVCHCTLDDHFVTPLPVGMMIGDDLPDGVWWPRLQTREEGLARLALFRQGQVLSLREGGS